MTWRIVPFMGTHDIYSDTCDVCGTACYPPFDVEDDGPEPNWLCCSQECADRALIQAAIVGGPPR